jgi:hypothetical protein
MRAWPALISLTAISLATTSVQGESLFNGSDLNGWEIVTANAVSATDICHYAAGGSLAVAGKPVGFLCTKATYHDFRLQVEWRWPDKPGNSGVLVHITSGPKDRAWPECYQIQLKHRAAGDLLPMAGATFAEPLTSPPGTTAIRAHQRTDSEEAPGRWNCCDIVCKGDTITVTINGVVQNQVTGCSAAAGRVGFQLEGAPYELRHVQITRTD